MSNYTKSTNFASKDNLISGDPLKIVKGTEINTEFDNISTAIATKADLASPTFTGTVNVAALTASSTITGNVTGNLTGAVTGSLTGGTGLPLTTGVTGTLPVANGGTGAATLTGYGAVVMNSAGTAATSVAPSTSGNLLTSNGTSWTSAAPSGGVTSAVAGNGVAVSAATGAVTFSASAPTFNTVGSYCFGYMTTTEKINVTAGTNYSAGTSNFQVQGLAMAYFIGCCVGTLGIYYSNTLSGTWKAMGGTFNAPSNPNVYGYGSVFVRVS